MCGIIGYSGPNKMHQSELKALLILAQNRGSDSTGVATTTEIVKKAEEATTFTKRELPTDKLVIGHTRAGTCGAVCDRNAHPFETESLVGVHNGIISNFHKLKNKEDVRDQEVDSEIIWTLIEKYGLEEGVAKLTGSLSLAWIQNKQLNLYRHRNPCYIGEKHGAIYFGSERGYLEFLECQNIRSTKEHTHYIFEEGELINQEEIKKQPGNTVYTGWSGSRSYNSNTLSPWQKNHNADKQGVRRLFPPKTAPIDANYVFHSDNVVVYYWFSQSTPEWLTIEPIYPNMDYGYTQRGKITDPEFIKEVKTYHQTVFESKAFQDQLKTVTNK